MSAAADTERLVELVLRVRDDRKSRDWTLMHLSLSEAIEHAEAMEARARPAKSDTGNREPCSFCFARDCNGECAGDGLMGG